VVLFPILRVKKYSKYQQVGISPSAQLMASTLLKCHWKASILTFVKDRLDILIVQKKNGHYILTIILTEHWKWCWSCLFQNFLCKKLL